MGRKKEITIENTKLAAHLRAAATRYFNCEKYIRGTHTPRIQPEERQRRLDKYEELRREAETIANTLDPSGQAEHERRLYYWPEFSARRYGRP